MAYLFSWCNLLSYFWNTVLGLALYLPTCLSAYLSIEILFLSSLSLASLRTPSGHSRSVPQNITSYDKKNNFHVSLLSYKEVISMYQYVTYVFSSMLCTSYVLNMLDCYTNGTSIHKCPCLWDQLEYIHIIFFFFHLSYYVTSFIILTIWQHRSVINAVSDFRWLMMWRREVTSAIEDVTKYESFLLIKRNAKTNWATVSFGNKENGNTAENIKDHGCKWLSYLTAYLLKVVSLLNDLWTQIYSHTYANTHAWAFKSTPV